MPRLPCPQMHQHLCLRCSPDASADRCTHTCAPTHVRTDAPTPVHVRAQSSAHWCTDSQHLFPSPGADRRSDSSAHLRQCVPMHAHRCDCMHQRPCRLTPDAPTPCTYASTPVPTGDQTQSTCKHPHQLPMYPHRCERTHQRPFRLAPRHRCRPMSQHRCTLTHQPPVLTDIFHTY